WRQPMWSLNWSGLSCVFPCTSSAGGQDEASETNSKRSDWTGSEIQRSIWENEVERGLADCQRRISAQGGIAHRFKATAVANLLWSSVEAAWSSFQMDE